MADKLDIMKNKIILVVILLTSCMALPKQPPLTSSEESFFNELKKQFRCSVKREVNPRATKENKEIDGWYLLEIDSIKCSRIRNIDSLRLVGLKIARKLHKEVLVNRFEYRYKYITVLFNCYPLPNEVTSQGFDYYPSELEK